MSGKSSVNPKTEKLISEMKTQGHLPVLGENVTEICQITNKSTTRAADLAAVILRDCGLSSNILSIANSSLYSPRQPIRTISNAVTFIGFEKVRNLTLGMALFKQTMKSAKGRKLITLYASSYFSGTFAMRLAKEAGVTGVEEVFITGLLYRLPWIALANTFPEDFTLMEELVSKDHMTYEQACQAVFGVGYLEIGQGVCDIYNMPNQMTRILTEDGKFKDREACLVHEASHIANMLFSDKRGGVETLESTSQRLGKLLNQEDFSVIEFIKHACEDDVNINRYFKLDDSDIEMMLSALKWGKGNPALITSHFVYDDELDELASTPSGDPELMIGHFLTDLMLGVESNHDINELIMTAQEALYRCLAPAEVFTAFFNKKHDLLNGKFYAGNNSLVKAEDFQILMKLKDSPLVQAINDQDLGEWHSRSGETLHLNSLKKYILIKRAIFVPIISFKQVIGVFFVGRTENVEFNDREKAWLKQLAMFIGKGFETNRK